MKTWTKLQIFTSIALFVLMAIRILAADPISNLGQFFGISISPSWVENLKVIRDLTNYLLFGWSFILVGIVIMVNRSDLQSLNIDPGFVAIFGAGSLTYWTYYRWPSGWIALLIPFAMYILYKKREFKFVKAEPIAGRITMILVIGFFLGLLLKYDSLTVEKTLWVAHLVATQIPFILIEEVIFRSLLWEFLVNLNWSGPKIVGLQAILFWLSHSNYMVTDPVFFWITTPIASIILGIIVWRSKSITASLFAHMFFNYLFTFYQI